MVKASDKLRRRQRLLRWGRLAVQIAFFLALPGLFSAGFNGFKYIFISLGSAVPIEGTAFLATLIVLLAATMLLGRVFCGFACAFGTLGDVLFQASSFVWSKTPFPMVRFPEKLVRILSLLKYVVLAFIALCCFFGVWGAFSAQSPWVAFAGLLGGSLEGIGVAAFVMLGLVALGMMVRERFFCQFLCPLGALFSLMPSVGPVGFTRNPARCPANCGRCRKACPVSIWPDADGVVHGECIACGRCAAGCPLGNVSLLSVGPVRASAAACVAGNARRRTVLMASGAVLAPVLVTAVLAIGTAETHPIQLAESAQAAVPEAPVVNLQTRDLPEERGGVATLELTMPKAALDADLKDGLYKGFALCGVGNDEGWQPYPLVVEVEVAQGRIAAVSQIYGDDGGEVESEYTYDAVENGMYLDRAIEGTGGRFSKGALRQIEDFLESGEETGGVDTVSGSTYSVVSIVQAYNRAVDAAVDASE